MFCANIVLSQVKEPWRAGISTQVKITPLFGFSTGAEIQNLKHHFYVGALFADWGLAGPNLSGVDYYYILNPNPPGRVIDLNVGINGYFNYMTQEYNQWKSSYLDVKNYSNASFANHVFFGFRLKFLKSLYIFSSFNLGFATGRTRYTYKYYDTTNPFNPVIAEKTYDGKYNFFSYGIMLGVGLNLFRLNKKQELNK